VSERVPDVYTFGPEHRETQTYADGTQVDHVEHATYFNGVKQGYVEIHFHKRRGRDGVPDMSVGITVVQFGPLEGGK